MLTTRQGIRVLGPEDLDDFLGLAAADPVINVFADYRARHTRLMPRYLGGEMWGRYLDGRLTAACHVAANLVPVQATVEDAQAFANRARARRRSVCSVFGPQDAVAAFWDAVCDDWAPAREVRWRQPHLEISGPPAVRPDPLVRRTVGADIDALMPACVAMHTEEVGVHPAVGGDLALYRARVLQLVSRGWSFARVEDGRVVFKAEVACASPYAAQIQGVYVDPSRRGQGLAAAGMAAVVEQVLADVAPVVSLYVNEHNTPARRAYARCGFVETGRFATVLF